MKKTILLGWCLLSLWGLSYAQNAGNLHGVETEERGIDVHNVVKMSGNWFIAYRNGIRQVHADDDPLSPEIQTKRENRFVLKRSYFTLKKRLNPIFSVRYTMDLTVDKEGDDAGNVETRLKYLYVKAKMPFQGDYFTGMWVEAGMVHRPWLDYEQKINTYRVQDNMFIERNKIFNSADFGVTVGGNIGPKMDKAFLEEVNGAMPGKWFSYVLGIYNGGGYSSAEHNKNKVFAARLSIRPFANRFPQLQLSGCINTGKGNAREAPAFNQLLGFMAYTGRHLTLTAQYHAGVGDFRAKYVEEGNPSKALKNDGYSFFGEYRIHKTPFAVWGRFDLFEVHRSPSTDQVKRIIGGLTYVISKNLRLVVNAEHNQDKGEKNDIYEVNLEVSF
ncbi:MAG: hypothetical protein CSA95_00600 [Bacteroidetes bacterium]|nr:MAG: hypothetical protein CSA95_00600 [Bacteroidota bacterium]